MGIRKKIASISRRGSNESDEPDLSVDRGEAQNQLAMELSARARNLQCSNNHYREDHLPTADEAWIHLKLLNAIQTLRTRIEHANGLFGLFDEDIIASFHATVHDAEEEATSEIQKTMLARLADKRWQVYIARAADRFAVWWQSLRKKTNARTWTVLEMQTQTGSRRAMDWTSGHGKRFELKFEDLPPPDVLAVWHAFMLNPRCYLQDCLRQDMMCLWQTGMPWAALDAALNSDGNYTFSDGETTILNTGVRANNLDDPMQYSLHCPNLHCQKSTSVPWTNISRVVIRHWASMKDPEEVFPPGSGYADPHFETMCHSCGVVINHDSLRGAKFLRDAQNLVPDPESADPGVLEPEAQLMPGTVLDAEGCISSAASMDDCRWALNRHIHEMTVYGDFAVEAPSITKISDTIYTSLANLPRSVRPVEYIRKSAFHTGVSSFRKVLSHYIDNASPFSLDLASAVIRQGNFIQKMSSIDFLHSSFGLATCARLVIKYARFMSVMTSRLDKITVPTLDVDLMWHTNQLTPSAYYDLCLQLTGNHFVDHDDKIGEGTLEDAFGQTTMAYEKRYREPYSECTCRHCEGMRALEHPATRMLFGTDIDPFTFGDVRSIESRRSWLDGRLWRRRKNSDGSVTSQRVRPKASMTATTR